MSAESYPVEILDDDYDDGTMRSNVADLSDAVVGHRIVSVEMGVDVPVEDRYSSWERSTATAITLDDGTRVFLVDTDDCCAYTELDSFLLNPQAVDHIITGVGTTNGFTEWHIFADMGDVLALKVDWSAGNPFYYGYGFRIIVSGASA